MAVGKIMDKLMGLIGLEVQEVEQQEFQEPGAGWVDESRPKGQRGNVVSLHSRPVKLVVVRPSAFEQVQGIADHLKSRRPVIVNLENTEKDCAKRILDFISGTAYALNGNMQKVSNSIFLFVPSNVEVSGESMDDFRSGLLGWHGNGRL